MNANKQESNDDEKHMCKEVLSSTIMRLLGIKSRTSKIVISLQEQIYIRENQTGT